jgi:hypothetical protein
LVKGGPVGKCVVGGVNDDKTAAIFYVVLELQAKIGRPVGAVIVEYDCLIFAELRREVAEVATGLRGGRDRETGRNPPTPFPIPAWSVASCDRSPHFVRQEAIRGSGSFPQMKAATKRIVLQRIVNASLFILLSPRSNNGIWYHRGGRNRELANPIPSGESTTIRK